MSSNPPDRSGVFMGVPGLLQKQSDDCVCELTAGGRGAICVLAVVGGRLPQRVGSFFSAANGKDLAGQPENVAVYGQWNQEDVIICMLSNRYLEIHCHGGDFAKRRITADLESAGFQINKSVFDDDHFSKIISIADQATLALAKATTEKVAAVLTWQSMGALDRAINEIESATESGKAAEAVNRIDEILSFAELGQHLVEPWVVAIVGVPNVGKSSLINRIVGFTRSIVMDMPGTTRDLVTAETAIDGWPVSFVDTAGLRESRDAIEKAGVELAEQAIESADLILHVVDVANPVVDRLEQEPRKTGILVWNKCDLADQAILESLPQVNKLNWPVAKISANTGHGVADLLKQIAQALVPVSPSPDQAVPFHSQHLQRLRELRSLALGRVGND